MLRAILAVVIALAAALAALAPRPAAAQSGDRQQLESSDAFYSRATGGVPPQ